MQAPQTVSLSSTSTAPQARLRALDPLRGLAALWVFVFHFHFSQDFQHDFDLLHRLFKAGDRAVPLFFVISGYCLAASAAIAAREGESPSSFLKRRAWRIYPAFWCSVLFILGVRSLIALAGVAGFGSIEDFRLRMPSYDLWDWVRILTLTRIFDASPGLWWTRYGEINGAYWTLGIEFQFYLVMAASLQFGRRAKLALVSVTILSLVTYFYPPLFFAVAGRGFALAFWSWFACGLAVYALVERGLTPARAFGRYASAVSGTGLAILWGACVVSAFGGYEIERLVFAIGSAASIWLLFGVAEPFERLTVSRWRSVRWGFRLSLLLGAASYSLYLVHNEISAVLGRAARWALPGRIPDAAVDIFVVGATVAAAIAFWWACERPFARARLVVGRRSALPRGAGATHSGSPVRKAIARTRDGGVSDAGVRAAA